MSLLSTDIVFFISLNYIRQRFVFSFPDFEKKMKNIGPVLSSPKCPTMTLTTTKMTAATMAKTMPTARTTTKKFVGKNCFDKQKLKHNLFFLT